MSLFPSVRIDTRQSHGAAEHENITLLDSRGFIKTVGSRRGDERVIEGPRSLSVLRSRSGYCVVREPNGLPFYSCPPVRPTPFWRL